MPPGSQRRRCGVARGSTGFLTFSRCLPNRVPHLSRRRSSFPDCSDLSSLISSTRSRLSRSLDKSFGSTSRTSPGTSLDSTSSRDSKEEEICKPKLSKKVVHRSPSESSSIGINPTRNSIVVTADVHDPKKKSNGQKKSSKLRSASNDSLKSVNSKNTRKNTPKGISAVHGYPDKKNLAESTPVKSTSESSEYYRPKSKARQFCENNSFDPRYHYYQNEFLRVENHDQPPSPAPATPHLNQSSSESKDCYSENSSHFYLNPILHPISSEEPQPSCSWDIQQDTNQSLRRGILQDREFDSDVSNEDISHPNDCRPRNVFLWEFLQSPKPPLQERILNELPNLQNLHLREVPRRQNQREVPSVYNPHELAQGQVILNAVPEDQTVSDWPPLRVYNRERYRDIQRGIVLSPVRGSERRLYDLPDNYFRRSIGERFLERFPSPIRRPSLGSSRQRSRCHGSNCPNNHNNSDEHMARMNSLEDHERKVIIEFCHLLEKSKQLFNGLRELPQYGHKQWHSYFGRTFDVYTKLWKFQQQHRAVLDNKYGLKRWQIGEIASKIGQLYYHFYLRTSETAYLNEAFSFYYAIRGRSYYTKASKEDKCELMVKKLRYYARFIVVCLLLKKLKLVRELIKELDKQIVEYGNTYDPDDQIEWSVVIDEVKAFIQSEPAVSVIHPDSYPMVLSHRLSPMSTPLVERSSQMTLSLHEVLIIGSSSYQVKFSELTIDMYRMLQTLEREPTGDIQYMYDDSPRQKFISTPNAPNSKGYNLEIGPRGENPHKYLLFKPSPGQILVYLASGCNDLPHNGALLLYISADGHMVPNKATDDAYDIGGLITTSKNDIYKECNKDQKNVSSKYKEPQCLHPGDLYPFTRRPLFIIVDSDNSYVFQNIPRHFGQPLVVLMSPLEVPSSLIVTAGDRRHQGSLFTLFLHSPLSALCYVCDVDTISLVHWDRAQAYVDTFLAEASQLLTRSRIDTMYISFMGDDFLRVLMLRFIFCEVTMRLHRAFRARVHLTRSSPPVPDDLLDHPALTHIIMDLAGHLQIRGHFHDPSAGPPLQKE